MVKITYASPALYMKTLFHSFFSMSKVFLCTEKK